MPFPPLFSPSPASSNDLIMYPVTKEDCEGYSRMLGSLSPSAPPQQSMGHHQQELSPQQHQGMTQCLAPQQQLNNLQPFFMDPPPAVRMPVLPISQPSTSTSSASSSSSKPLSKKEKAKAEKSKTNLKTRTRNKLILQNDKDFAA
jgi:hypothetical protein